MSPDIFHGVNNNANVQFVNTDFHGKKSTRTAIKIKIRMFYLKRFFELVDEITAAVGRRRHYICAIYAQKQSSRFLG